MKKRALAGFVAAGIICLGVWRFAFYYPKAEFTDRMWEPKRDSSDLILPCVAGVLLTWAVVRRSLRDSQRPFVLSLAGQICVLVIGTVISAGLGFFMGVYFGVYLGGGWMSSDLSQEELFFRSIADPIAWTVSAIATLATIYLTCRRKAPASAPPRR